MTEPAKEQPPKQTGADAPASSPTPPPPPPPPEPTESADQQAATSPPTSTTPAQVRAADDSDTSVWQVPPPPPTTPPPSQPWRPNPAPPPPPPPSPQPNQQWPPQAQTQWQQPGQQPAQQWQPQPGQPSTGQWQGQQAGTPPWAQPGTYPGQPADWRGRQQWAGPAYATSALVALAAVLLLLFGLLAAIGGMWSLTQGAEIGRFIRDNDIAVFGRQIARETLRAVLTPLPGVLFGLAVAHVLAALGIFAHKGWARWLGVLVSLLGLAVGVVAVAIAIALAPGASVPVLSSVVLLLGYAFALLALVAGGGHFRARYGGG